MLLSGGLVVHLKQGVEIVENSKDLLRLQPPSLEDPLH